MEANLTPSSSGTSGTSRIHPLPPSFGVRRGHLLLRRLDARDHLPLAEAERESKASLVRWMGWNEERFHPDAARRWIDASARAWDMGEAFDAGIFSSDGGILLGVVSINQINRINRFANLAYWVRPSARRRRVATSAAALFAEAAFSLTGLLRLELVVEPDNVASAGVAARLGACHEGLARSRLLLRGRPLDADMFSLLPGDLRLGAILSVPKRSDPPILDNATSRD